MASPHGSSFLKRLLPVSDQPQWLGKTCFRKFQHKKSLAVGADDGPGQPHDPAVNPWPARPLPFLPPPGARESHTDRVERLAADSLLRSISEMLEWRPDRCGLSESLRSSRLS